MNHRDKDMKTMTEEECRSFVLSGFIPTSNDDVADIQDCFLRHNILFLTGLLLDAVAYALAQNNGGLNSAIEHNGFLRVQRYSSPQPCGCDTCGN